MATLAGGVPTLYDLVTELAPDGSQQDMAEILTQHTEVLSDMTFMQGNLLTGHRDSARTVLPTPTFRGINEGVPITKGQGTQIEESCAMLEDFSQCDRELAILSGNTAGYRLKQARPHMIGFAHKMAQTLFYGNANVNPKEFTGLAARYWTTNPAKSATAANVIDAGGSGTGLRSIWLVGWSEDTITGIVPKNAIGGLQHEDATSHVNGNDSGEALQDANGNLYMGYRDHWTWRCGLFVKDWRYAIRIANVDLDTITKDASAGADLVDLMVQAVENIEGTEGVRPAFYMPRTIRSFLRRQQTKQAKLLISSSEIAGKRVTEFDGIPVRRVDALNVEETQVVA